MSPSPTSRNSRAEDLEVFAGIALMAPFVAVRLDARHLSRSRENRIGLDHDRNSDLLDSMLVGLDVPVLRRALTDCRPLSHEDAPLLFRVLTAPILALAEFDCRLLRTHDRTVHK